MALRASSGLLGSLVFAGILAVPALALADVQHTIGRGQTIEAIANRYHVTSKAIVDANHLKNVKRLHVGDVLTIPGVKESKTDAAKGKTESKGGVVVDHTPNKVDGDHTSGHTAAAPSKKGEKVAKVGTTNGRETTTFAMKPKTPGVIHVHRIATTENFDIHVGDKRGRVSPTALKEFEKMMRSPAGLAHPIEPRLVALLGVVSNHFGSRKLEVVSGFRPFVATQFNPHSNHMHGKAVDFRVAGVPNEAVRDFCRTLKNVGCGYYPNSVFVHMDVREQSAFWIDYSKPGEAPRYNAPNAEADEGTSDVQDEAKPSTDAAPTEAPAVPTMPAAPGVTTPPAGDSGEN